MHFEIVFSEHALIDIEETFHYYNEQSDGLGSRFVNQVQSAVKKIAANPFLYAVRYERIRCAGVWKFPFLVHFNVNSSSDVITILAVFSTHRNPKLK